MHTGNARYVLHFVTRLVTNVFFFETRMLVYDYVDNGNLEQWIHGDVGDKSPLTWDIRTNIILGMAKGYV